MSQYYGAPPNAPYGGAPSSAQNLQFYPTSYAPADVSGHATPAQASYGYGGPAASSAGGGGYGVGGANAFGGGGGFGGAGAVSGRMGEQGGLRTGWLAAFSTEGYDGEPPLLEELGVNFDHIRQKVSASSVGHAIRRETDS
jgi:protein YIPF5/7